jgi:hypothetical protein
MLGVMLLTPALTRAKDGDKGCKGGDDEKKVWKGSEDCKKDPNSPAGVPEPGIAILVGSGLLALGGFVALRRKQASS